MNDNLPVRAGRKKASVHVAAEVDHADALLEARLRMAGSGLIPGLPPRPARPEQKFTHGTLPRALGRYTLLRLLGEGAMGRVYEAQPHGRSERVALKVFRDIGPATARLLKREFRALSGIAHPSLAVFHELCVRAQLCYFTMELVEGRDLLSYVMQADPFTGVPRADPKRLRASVLQLASAVHALHAAGRIHRDLKPSNVLVRDLDARLVVLDFGLISAVGQASRSDITFAGQPVGTPAYMAPEQFGPATLTAAIDCYAIGCMIYHALTGQPPFIKYPAHELALARAGSVPALPSELADAEDLRSLCLDLLQPDPAKRADCADIIRRLTVSPVAHVPLSAPVRPVQREALVGRASELAQLASALQEAESRPVALTATGSAGVGKSALIQHFIDSLDPRAYVVLAARCHEQESMRYKTLDGIVDALVRYLTPRPALELASLVPRYVLELTTMFPALGCLESFRSTARQSKPSADEPERKRRAIVALCELLGRIADRQRLVIWNDDMQWGDNDSVDLIRRLLTSPDAPACLCIGTIRVRAGSECDPLHITQRFFGPDVRPGSRLSLRTLSIGALANEDAQKLAERLLGDDESRAQAAQIALDSEGNPLLILQLSDFAGSRISTVGRADEASLESMVDARLAELSSGALRLLQMIALADGAIEISVAATAAEVVVSATHAALYDLKVARLVRTQRAPGSSCVELYHARLTGPILRALAPGNLRELHMKLARALSDAGARRDERLVRHLRRARRDDEAIRHLLDSAKRAARTLAHERAAQLYALALGCSTDEAQRRHIQLLHAEALRRAGRGPEAARAYLTLAEATSDRAQRAHLRCTAAQEFLLSGDLAQGRALLARVVHLPRGRLRILLGLIGRRLRLRVQALRFIRRQAAEVSATELAQLDRNWMLGQTIRMVDPLLGKYLQSDQLLRALSAGEPRRVVRALVMEAMQASTTHGRYVKRRVERMLGTASSLAAELQHPFTTAIAAIWTAACAYCMGEPERAIREASVAEAILRENWTDVGHELAVTQLVVLGSQMMLGHWSQFCERAREASRGLLQASNIYHSALLRVHTQMACLVVDDLDGSARELAIVRRDSPQEGSPWQYLALLAGEARTHLYCGRGVLAWQHLSHTQQSSFESLMFHTKFMRTECLALRGRAAALAYAQTSQPQYRRAAKEAVGRLLTKPSRGVVGSALLIRASLAATDGELQSALSLLRQAEQAFVNDALPFFAALTRYQSALLNDGAPESERAIEEAARAVAQSGVRNVPAFVRMYSGHPGLAERNASGPS